MGEIIRKKDQVEISILRRFGLRVSILEAWEESLRIKGAAIPSSVSGALARARVKVSSGCFTACEVGCELGQVEATLVSLAGALGEEAAEPWLEMLGECMSEKSPIEDIERNIQFPAIRAYMNRFQFDGACGACDT
jgi:hypothetical protein